MPNAQTIRNHYDVPTAVTFLLAGLGIGSLLTLLMSPRENGPAASVADSRRGDRSF